MGQRLDLQALFESLIGNRNVYFQPPENIQMKFPCIVYNRDYAVTQYADNNPYHYKKRYMVTVIDRNPDSLIPDKIVGLPLTRFVRHYVTDNLHHDVFDVYF